MKTALMGVSALALMASGALASAQDDQTLLLRHPAVSGDTLVFMYAGDIWTSALDGSNPRRLTTAPLRSAAPHISPDGQYVAFTGTYENNADVYVISVDGGQPQRLTWHRGRRRGARLDGGWPRAVHLAPGNQSRPLSQAVLHRSG
jgi:tricorn protease